jgi:hypothetical protein
MPDIGRFTDIRAPSWRRGNGRATTQLERQDQQHRPEDSFLSALE